MKLLHILGELQYSGAELMLFSAAPKFEKEGIHLTILSTGAQEGIYADHFRKLGWPVVHIPFERNWNFFKKLHSFIKASSFDIVHIHTERAFIYTALSAYLAGSTKIVRTVHNNFLFSGYLKFRRQMHHFMAQHFLNVKFTSISASVMETEKNRYFTKTTLIHNWIDVENFKNHSAKSGSDYSATSMVEPLLISVGKCLVEKNHMAILQLVKIFSKRNINSHYIHIGCGPLEAKEREWTSQNKLEESVTFISHTNQVGSYLSQSNFYLMPSLFEGVGNACLEAMAAGLFCIVNDAPGLNTLIQHEKTGLVIDFNDLEKVADTILSVCMNPDYFMKICRQARSFVEENHSLSNVEGLIKLYGAA